MMKDDKYKYFNIDYFFKLSRLFKRWWPFQKSTIPLFWMADTVFYLILLSNVKIKKLDINWQVPKAVWWLCFISSPGDKTRQNTALKDVLCDAGMKELFFKVLIDVYYYNFNVSWCTKQFLIKFIIIRRK